MDVVHLYVVSYHGDMWKERDTLFRDVLPELRAWCENKTIQLVEKDIRWGGYMSMDDLTHTKRQIQTAYCNGEMPIFIHLTSECLGLVPMYGEAEENITADIHKKLQVNSEEMDILHGAYRVDNPNSVFLVRNDDFLDNLDPENRRIFVRSSFFSGPQHEICSKCLQKYSENRIFHYSYSKAHSNPATHTIEIEFDRSLFFKLLSYIKARIELERPGLPTALTPELQLRHSQESCMKAISQRVQGRDKVISQLEDYIETGGNDVPLLVLGGPGSGKSSIMARAADKFSQMGYLNKYLPDSDRNDGRSWLVFYVFVGAVPGSMELLPMMQRLLKELNVTTTTSVPCKVDAAAQMCCSALSGGTTRPLVLIVDAVDQFEEEAASQIMSWVPPKLAPNVRCILSMNDNSIQHRNLMSRESKPQELQVRPLHFDARKLVVTEMLSERGWSLNRDEMNCLLAKKGSENPLWLSLATEEIRTTAGEPPMFDRCIRNIPENLQDLLESILERLEADLGSLLVACICLIEVSMTGLLEQELQYLLGALQERVTPSPYEEKEETESSEKDLGRRKEGLEPLSETQWLEIYRALRPYLRPYGDTRDGRLVFYHTAFSGAVRTKYFKAGRVNECSDESGDLYRHWHQQLADYFDQCEDIQRKAEEYLGHLVQIEDRYRLCQALCDWSILDKLYHDEYSSQLLGYWRKAGGTDEMICCYTESLIECEAMQPRDDELIALRYELVARIYLQAGRYTEALDLAKTVIKWVEKELGNRAERMVELTGLMAEIYEEKLKLNDFVSTTQLPDLRKTIMFARRSIELRKSFTGDHHKLKLAMSLMKLAFSLESWSACGGDEAEMTADQAIQEGNDHIDKAISIFSQMKDAGHYAEALMTKGVLAPRGSMEQLKHYNKAMEICRQVYGEDSLLSSRLYINIGIVYEDNGDYVKAYDYFRRWAETSEIVLGPDHPKTVRAKGVLREPRYRLVVLRIKEHRETNNQNEGGVSDVDERTINDEVANLEEDEDGYQSHDDNHRGNDDDDDEEEDLERRENGEQQSDMQQLIEASDIMQRIFNDIWQHMGDDGHVQGAAPQVATDNQGATPQVAADNQGAPPQVNQEAPAQVNQGAELQVNQGAAPQPNNDYTRAQSPSVSQGAGLALSPGTSPTEDSLNQGAALVLDSLNQGAALVLDSLNQGAAPTEASVSQGAALMGETFNRDAPIGRGLDTLPVMAPCAPSLTLHDNRLDSILQAAVNNPDIDISDNRYNDVSDNDEPLEAVITRFLQDAQSNIDIDTSSRVADTSSRVADTPSRVTEISGDSATLGASVTPSDSDNITDSNVRGYGLNNEDTAL